LETCGDLWRPVETFGDLWRPKIAPKTKSQNPIYGIPAREALVKKLLVGDAQDWVLENQRWILFFSESSSAGDWVPNSKTQSPAQLGFAHGLLRFHFQMSKNPMSRFTSRMVPRPPSEALPKIPSTPVS